MTTKKLMFGAAIAATLSLVFPSQALATITATTVNQGGTSTTATSMQSGDLLDVSAKAPSSWGNTSTPGVTREVTRTTLGVGWTGKSLQLQNSDAVTYPEGWDLEYTVDGTTWTTTPPTDFKTVIGVRTAGSYTKTSASKFESTTDSILVANAGDFVGAAGGDGFDITFVGDRVYNVYHHASKIYLDCHLKSDASQCYGGSAKAFDGYETPNSSHAFYDSASNKMYIPVMKTSVSEVKDMGVACISLADVANPVLCATPFVKLGSNVNRQNISTATQVGRKVWIPNPYDWTLKCFDMSKGLECTGSGYTAGGWAMPHTTKVTASPWTVYGRTINISGKIFWSSDTKIGCFDPATGTNCGTSTPAVIGASILTTAGSYSNVYATENTPFQFPMFPVRDANGAILGACYFASAQCLTLTGATDDTILPSNLKAWMKEHPLPKWVSSDSGELGEYDNKIYFPVGRSTTATSDVYCFDYSTGSACSGFGTSGTKTGVNTEIYSIQLDPEVPNCMWTNGNAGTIKTFNASTGASGCATATATVRLPYKSILPRMACNEEGRITRWGTVGFHSPGISASVLRVTVYDSNNRAISGYVHRSLTVVGGAGSEDGNLDLSALPVSVSGTQPTILVTATITVAGSILSQLTANVGFEADEPELCVYLKAIQKCTDPTLPAAGDLNVEAGVVTTTTRIATTGYYSGGSTAYDEVNETLTNNITGTGASVCGASVGGGGSGGTVITAPIVNPTKAKRPPVKITIGGFKDGSPVLTKAIQSKIAAFIKKYNDYPVIETVGFTEGPQVLKTDYALSKARAVNATTYIKKTLKKKFSTVKIKSGQDKVEASKVRRITITLTDE